MEEQERKEDKQEELKRLRNVVGEIKSKTNVEGVKSKRKNSSDSDSSDDDDDDGDVNGTSFGEIGGMMNWRCG